MVLKKYLISIIIILTFSEANAQFSKKFTADLGVGYFINPTEWAKEDGTPYVFGGFWDAFAFTGRFQYNITDKIALGIKSDYIMFWWWDDPREDYSPSDYWSYFELVNLQPLVRYKILNKKLSPYIEGGIGVTFYYGYVEPTTKVIDNYYPAGPDDWWVSIDQVELREPGIDIYTSGAFSYFFGIGAQYDISQSIGIFACFSYHNANSSSNQTLQQDLVYLGVNGGININFVKSKTL